MLKYQTMQTCVVIYVVIVAVVAVAVHVSVTPPLRPPVMHVHMYVCMYLCVCVLMFFGCRLMPLKITLKNFCPLPGEQQQQQQ